MAVILWILTTVVGFAGTSDRGIAGPLKGADFIQYYTLGHLASAPGPQISSREGWEVLGREFRVVLDFGVAAVDWRGGYRNAGAA